MNKGIVIKRLIFGLLVLSLLAMPLIAACSQPAPAPSPAPTAAPKPAPSPTVAPSPTAAPSPSPTPAAKAKTMLKAISFLPPNNARTVVYKDFLNLIGQRSNGELGFEYLGGPEVIPATEQGQAIRKGVVAITMLGASSLEGLVPEARLLSLSRLTPQEERTGPAFTLMSKYFAKASMYYVGRLDPKIDPLNFTFYFMKKVSTLADLKGLRCAAAGTYIDAAAKALGMSFSVIKTEDAYTAMDRGMIDAFVYSFDGALTLSLHEVVKFALDQAVYRSNTVIPMNQDAWSKLSPALQKLVQDTYVEFEPKLIEASAKGIIDARKKFDEKKVEIIKFSAADNEKFMDIAYEADAKEKIKEMPESGLEFLKAVKAIK